MNQKLKKITKEIVLEIQLDLGLMICSLSQDNSKDSILLTHNQIICQKLEDTLKSKKL